MSELSIQIKIHTRNYKIKIDASNEAYVRQVATDINNKIASFKKQFPQQDDQDYMAMVLIDFITSTKHPIANNSNTLDLDEQLKKISLLLD